MFYVFVMVLPFTKGNVLRSFIVGLVVMVIGLYLVTYMAADFTTAAADVYAKTQDKAVAVPEGFSAGSLDFCSSPLANVIYASVRHLGSVVGVIALSVITLLMVVWNKMRIKANK